ncbi:hypothetical protein BASA81_011023 [Batrachochytrium salamandrivorans]|nr:hypothetical protein BASA81_011023 [Batrachochytrium salamandrivorans]
MSQSLVLLCTVPRVPYQFLETRGLKIERCSVFASLGTDGLIRTESVLLVDPTAAAVAERWFTVALTLAPATMSSIVFRLWVTTDSPSSSSSSAAADNSNNSTTVMVSQHSLNLQAMFAQLPPPGSSFCAPLTLTLENDLVIKLVRDARTGSALASGVFQQPNALQASFFHHASRTLCRETCFEVPFAGKLSQSFLKTRIDLLQAQLAGVESLRTQALKTQGFIPGECGFSLVQFRVDSITNLVQVQQRQKQTTTLSSPYCKISLSPQRVVGRTNTEYRTTNPQFGSNANLGLAEHSAPATYPTAERFGRLRVIGSQVWFETNMSPKDELVFEVFHERHSVRDAGLTSELMCIGRLSFATLLCHNSDSVKVNSVTLLDQFNSNCGVMQVQCKLFKSSTVYKESTVVKLPTLWLETRVCAKLRRQISQLKLAAEMPLNATGFKPSEKKHNIDFATFTTNLHQEEFLVEESGKTTAVLLTTTCGVPSAIPLTLTTSETGLKSSARGEGLDLVKQHQTLLPGSEEEFRCPLSPPCTQPFLNLDCSCGNAQHLANLPKVAPSSSSSSLMFRSAAASMMSKLASSATTAASTVTGASKPPGFAMWQVDYEAQLDFAFREVVCLSQALPSVAANFLGELSKSRSTPADALQFGKQLQTAGYLIGWESLVSSHGKEMAMLQDVRGVVEWLNANLELLVKPSKDKEWEVTFLPPNTLCVGLSAARIKLLFGSSSIIKIKPVIVLFSQGVNEKQSLANVVSKDLALIHSQINQQSVQLLRQYAVALPGQSAQLPHLVQLVMNQRSDEKQVDILWSAELCVREMNGGMQIMCKSGKDRTAMAVTLEQSKLLLDKVPDTLYFANLFREFGIRIQVAHKNIGRRVYSFNTIQRMALPKEYRPPVSVIQDLKTSYLKQNS